VGVTIESYGKLEISFLKMAAGRNCSMSGHHYLPTYQILMISDNVEFLQPISNFQNAQIQYCSISM
jgi:hypothetical protein